MKDSLIVHSSSAIVRKKPVFAFHSWIFRVHSFMTGSILFLLSFSVSLWLYAGKPVVCNNGNEARCTSENALVPISSPTGDTSGAYSDRSPDVRDYSTYEWVGIVLFFQAILCCVPHWVWSCSSGNERLKVASFYFKRVQVNCLASQSMIVIKFLVCEFFCFVNAVAQSITINYIFDSAFTQNGVDVLKYTKVPWKFRNDSFVQAFPRRLKCQIEKFGRSGSLETHGEICWLTISTFIEKIYMVSWFWFVFLSIISALIVLYHSAIILLHYLKSFDLQLGSKLLKHERVEYMPMNDIKYFQPTAPCDF